MDADTGYLVLDVTGTTQTGEIVNTAGVRFALLDLAAATENTATDARVELAGVPATLTAAGAAAFGTYPEGEELDPVDLAFSVAAECGAVAVASENTAAGSAGAADDGADLAPVAASADVAWLIGLVVALLVLALLAAIVLLRRRAVSAR